VKLHSEEQSVGIWALREALNSPLLSPATSGSLLSFLLWTSFVTSY